MGRLRRVLDDPNLLWTYAQCKSKEIVSYHALGRTGYGLMPARVGIGVNSICNLRCLMCDIGQTQQELHYYSNVAAGGTLDLRVFKNLIDNLKTFCPTISLNLTEPLLHKNIVEFVQYIREKGMQCEIGTNGYLLPKLAEELVEVGLSDLCVSIDGPPEVHNRIRGVADSFQRAYEGIRHIVEHRRKLNRAHPKIRAAYAISNHNSHCLDEAARLLQEAGVDAITFGHLNFISGSMAEAHNREFGHVCQVRPSSISATDPEHTDTVTLTRQIQLVKERYPGLAVFMPSLTGIQQVDRYYKTTQFIGRTRCSAPWRNAQVLSNGDVIPASRCFHIVMGNINEQPFTEIFNSQISRSFRKFLRRIGTTPACARCCAIF